MRFLVALLALIIAPASASAADRAHETSLVLQALRNHFGDRPDPESRVVIGWADLNGDGRPEAFAYMTSLCGSGGCNLYILQRLRHRYGFRGMMTIVKPPIAALGTRHHGWRDITVYERGYGLGESGYRAVLAYDGHFYPRNPSVAPAYPMRGHPHETVVIAGYDHDVPLYPDVAGEKPAIPLASAPPMP